MLTKQEEIELIRLLEIEDRERVRNNFYSFCVYMDPVFFNDGKPHLKLIADAFQEVAEGNINQLAVSMPPRAGKSYITSLFCAWMLGKYPDGSVMRNSYAAKLAEKFSKDIRDGVIPSEKYKKIFPDVKISKNNAAVDGWSINTNTQPAYFCAGVGGPITGFGCRTLAILDDPIKNIEEALSETVIENVWNWYTSTHLSRLESGCPEIHIATRWTRKDPIGRLTDPNSEYYKPGMKVISIPALDDKGKSFCEDIKTTAEYYEIKRIQDSFIWEAEYMQHPIESKGLLYPIEELHRFTIADISTKKPDGVLGFTDTADRGDDFLCSAVGKVYGECTYITDVVFTQDGVEITEPLVAQMLIDAQCYLMKIESNNGGSSYARNVRNLIQGKSPCMVTDEHQSTNKETRILMNAGYVKEHFYFRSDYKPGSDYDKYMRYLTSYVKLGKNKHDDAPDGTTGLAELAKTMVFEKEQGNKRDLFLYREQEETLEADQSYINY
jgi:predicted phage terminase large subunit-like protein